MAKLPPKPAPAPDFKFVVAISEETLAMVADYANVKRMPRGRCMDRRLARRVRR